MNDRVQVAERQRDDVLATCVTLFQRYRSGTFLFQDQELLKALEAQLKSLFTFGAKMVCQFSAETIPTEVDWEHPGYVVMSTSADRIHIPFFLMSAFPRGDLLNSICNLGQSVKIGQDSIVCISGSSCYLDWKIPGADVDFCEYVSLGDSATAAGLLSAIRHDGSDVVCYKVTIDRKNTWSRPWPKVVRTADSKFVKRVQDAISSSTSRHVKFITDVPPLGVLETTNRLLRLDAARSETGEANASFTAQEAPILGEGAWIPRSLTDPLEIGRYLLWLSDVIKELIAESTSKPRAAIKATRRAIAATRLLLWDKEGNALRLLLNDGARLAALYDRCELYSAIAGSEDPSIDRFKVPLRRTIDALREHTASDEESYRRLTLEETEEMGRFSVRAVAVVSGIARQIDRNLGIA